MPERACGRSLKEILRLRFVSGLSTRQIGASRGLSPSTVQSYLRRFAVAKLQWPLPSELDDEALAALLFPQEGHPQKSRVEPDFAQVHIELRRKHVTKQLLWQEYREAHPEGYEYSRFCECYQQWLKRASPTMRQTHVAGEKMFVDFSGSGLDIVDAQSGECLTAVLFVAVLGASSYTYVEPCLSQDLQTWVGCHVRALEFFDGAARVWVPDNLKAAVTQAHRYEPLLNRTYEELAEHYGAAVIPARSRKPRDKAKVEAAVGLASRWILAVLRHHHFQAMEQVRQAVRPLLDKLNDKPMQKIGRSRRALFEELEHKALQPLPERPYQLAEWKVVRPNIDYHIEFDQHYYSVPHELVRERLEVRATETTVEILRGSSRVASHPRSYDKHKHTTQVAHMPRAHREQADWTPERIVAWAKSVGPKTALLVEQIMKRRMHPEQGFRACLGVMRLRKAYSDERIERACARAGRYRAFTYRSVVTILQNGLDQQSDDQPPQRSLPLHQNIRGGGYYH